MYKCTAEMHPWAASRRPALSLFLPLPKTLHKSCIIINMALSWLIKVIAGLLLNRQPNLGSPYGLSSRAAPNKVHGD